MCFSCAANGTASEQASTAVAHAVTANFSNRIESRRTVPSSRSSRNDRKRMGRNRSSYGESVQRLALYKRSWRRRVNSALSAVAPDEHVADSCFQRTLLLRCDELTGGIP